MNKCQIIKANNEAFWIRTSIFFSGMFTKLLQSKQNYDSQFSCDKFLLNFLWYIILKF